MGRRADYIQGGHFRAPSSTRDQLLEAAQELFSQRGFHATSVRDIAAATGATAAAINYHFGSKDGLIRAVLAQAAAPMHAAREARLAELETAGRAPTIEEVVRAFFETLFDGTQVPPVVRVGRLLNQVTASGDDRLGEFWLEIFRPLMPRFLALLGRAAPHLGRWDVFWRYHAMLAAAYDGRLRTAFMQHLARDEFGAGVHVPGAEDFILAFVGAFKAPSASGAPRARAARTRRKPRQ